MGGDRLESVLVRYEPLCGSRREARRACEGGKRVGENPAVASRRWAPDRTVKRGSETGI